MTGCCLVSWKGSLSCLYSHVPENFYRNLPLLKRHSLFRAAERAELSEALKLQSSSSRFAWHRALMSILLKAECVSVFTARAEDYRTMPGPKRQRAKPGTQAIFPRHGPQAESTLSPVTLRTGPHSFYSSHFLLELTDLILICTYFYLLDWTVVRKKVMKCLS